MTRFLLTTLLILCSACGPIPTDPNDTLDRIRARGELRLGHTDGVALEPARDLLNRLAERTNARLSVQSGPGEPLLWALERGELDLVVGQFAAASPWSRSVWLSPPIAGGEPPKEQPVLRFAAPKGENGWIRVLSETLEGQ